MALLALVGVFAIYKLQDNNNSLQEIKHSLISYLHFYKLNLDDLYNNIDNLIETISSIASNPFDINNPYTSEHRKWEAIKRLNDTNKEYQEMKLLHISLRKTNTALIYEMKSPFYWTLGIIIASIVLLPLASIIHECFNYYEIIPMVLVISFNIFALMKNKKFIFMVLKM